MSGKKWRALAGAGSREDGEYGCVQAKGRRVVTGVGLLLGAGPQPATPFSLYPKEIREQKSVKENWLIYRLIA